MKSLAILALVASSSLHAQPQSPKPEAQREAMAKLAWLVGEWEGSASFITQRGESKVASWEGVQLAAGGTALLIQGRHFSLGADGKPGPKVHDAAGLLVFDDRTGQYRLTSQTQEGRHGQFDARVEGETLHWGMNLPGAQMRYRISRNEQGQWEELGQYCRDGAPCVDTLRMTLSRKAP